MTPPSWPRSCPFPHACLAQCTLLPSTGASGQGAFPQPRCRWQISFLLLRLSLCSPSTSTCSVPSGPPLLRPKALGVHLLLSQLCSAVASKGHLSKHCRCQLSEEPSGPPLQGPCSWGCLCCSVSASLCLSMGNGRYLWPLFPEGHRQKGSNCLTTWCVARPVTPVASLFPGPPRKLFMHLQN